MAKIQRALKVRIYPTQEQQDFLNKTLGCCRFIYNQMLAERIEVYKLLKDNKRKLYEHKYKTEAEYKKEYEFLKEVDSVALQQARNNLENAYSNFFKSIKKVRKGEQVGFPKFKSKHNHNDSYRTIGISRIDFGSAFITIPKCPKIRFNQNLRNIKSWYRNKSTVLKNVTISKTPSGKYYASCLFEGVQDYSGIPKEIGTVKGLDMSLQQFYVDEQGNSPEYKRNYREYEVKLAKNQKVLSRKTKGSKNYEKQRVKVARIHERITNKRRDFLEKLSNRLIQENDCIVVEHLNLKGMSQALHLGKSVMDTGYSSFINKLKYKALWNDKTVILADQWFASSKTCHQCGYINKNLLLHEREWDCPMCGVHHLRDQNAAINLKNYGEKIRVASSESKPVENLQLGGEALALLALNGFYEAGNASRETCKNNALR